MKAIKKAVNGTTTTKTTIRPGATTDSTTYYKGVENKYKKLLKSNEEGFGKDSKVDLSPEHKAQIYNSYKKTYKQFADTAVANQQRQANKGKPGYDANGFPKKKLKAGGMIKRAQNGESYTKDDKGYTYTKQITRPEGKRTYQGKSTDQSMAKKIADYKIRNNPSDSVRTVKPVKPVIKKNGGMIKRADGSYSKRGLWDNIRANKGSGKKPTKQMLVQEKKIKAKSKK